MAGRHALLIGVPKCDDDRFTDIGDVVRNDVTAMRRALEQSGYSMTTLGVEDGSPEPTRTRIVRAIRSACKQTPRDGVLLLYFSGHGVTVDGQDYLVPSDADRDGDVPDPQNLVPVIPADLTDSRARLVAFFVDACRDDPAQAHEPGAVGGYVPYPAEGSFVLVTGCEAGQRCHYTETGSVFTQALAQVLDRRHPARTLAEVVTEVSSEIRRRAARNEELRQSPDVRHRTMLMDAKNVVICDGDELTGAWRRAAGTTSLWRCCREEENGLDAAREAVLGLVESCARQCGEAYDALRVRAGVSDPWFDQNHPIRVLERITTLFDRSASLSPAEAAIVTAAPFLREVVLAEGVRLAASVAPTDFSRTYRDGPRTDLEITHEMHQQIVRRAEGLGRRGLTTERDALAMWLVHQWLAGRQSVWHSPAAAECCQQGARLLDGHVVGMTAREMPKLVETLLRTVGAGPADPLVVERLGAAYLNDRWRAIAAVLWLGGILAADLRRMPAVIADHIGTRMELPLPAVKNAADRLTWTPHGDSLALQMPCDHPAQYAVFEDVVARAATARETIAGLSIDTRAAAALPARFTAEGLRPERRPDDTPAFEVPLPRFRLSEDKIRELLMGRQLYDDPSLSIRELYQNALDACRYRDARIKGLRRSGREPGEWIGRITFRQGFEDGREYIECEDNGVGMDTETLKQVFANAGERFVYRESFRAEQASWQELNPPLQLISNSQFGVGVFSYFMLADEITVVTRPVGTNGIVADDAYRVDIASSGSLFQITSADDLPAGGTRVRLYLASDDEHVSVLTTMRRLLWISDFRVEVTSHDAAREVWESRELRYQDETAVSLKFEEDLWWVSGEGGLAADGIRTNEEIFGLIVNLRDTRRPQFTVDRKKLRKWDRAWVSLQIAASLPELMKWPGLTLSWLWQVAASAPEVAQQIFDHMLEEDVAVPVGSSWGQGTQVSVRDTGCLPDDGKLFDPTRWNYYVSRWFGAWRAGQWAPLVTSKSNVRDRAIAAAGGGFPIVDPIDAQLLDKLSHTMWDNAVSIDQILLALAHPDQTAADRLRRLRRYSITGLDLTELRDCPSLPVTIDKDDAPLFRALAAWSPPGTPPRPCPAGWLVKTSTELDRSLGDAMREAARLIPENWTPPDLDLGPLTDYICTNADAALLSVGLDGQPPWTVAPLEPAHVVEASAALGREIEQVLSLADNLAPLGVTVAGRGRYPVELTPTEVEALRQVRDLGERLTPIQLVMIAGRVGRTVHEVHRELQALEANGFLARPDAESLPNASPGPEVVTFIETNLMPFRPSRRLRTLSSHSAHLTIASSSQGPRVSRRQAAPARALIPFTNPREPVTWAELTDLAGSMFCSVSEARKALLAAFPDAQVPEPTPNCHGLSPFFEIGTALVGTTWRRDKPVTWRLHPAEIAGGAAAFNQSLGEFLARLQPYRELGAPVPTPDEATMESLYEIFPDEYDEDMLTGFDEDEAPVYLSTIDPLLLVRIAGRLGWSPAEAHRRLTRLVPIGLTLTYPAEGCPDEIVRWQDLLSLTEYLDGYPPAVSEPTTAHIARAAAETGESTDRIAERVRLYAPLFGLDQKVLDV